MKYWEFIIVIVLVLYYNLYQSSSISKDFQKRLKVLPNDLVISQPTLTGKFGYVQYATDFIYLQLAIENLISIHDPVGDLIIIYNENLSADPKFKALHDKAQIYNIIMEKVPIISNDEINIWHESFTKIHIFNLDYDRLVYFDADSMLLNTDKSLKNHPQNLNELFNIPWNIDIAMPQAYWLSNQHLAKQFNTEINSLLSTDHKFSNRRTFFASHVIVLKPNKKIYKDLLNYIYNPWWWHILNRSKVRKSNDFDMEIINKYIDDNLHKGDLNFGIIDHRIYGVLTGEFKEVYHAKFLSDPELLPYIDHENNHGWDSYQVLEHIKLIHFSDEPIPKPWIKEDNLSHYNTFKIFCKSTNLQQLNEYYPINKPRLIDDCSSVEIWNWIRNEFKLSRSMDHNG